MAFCSSSAQAFQDRGNLAFIAIPFDILLFAQTFVIKIEIEGAKVTERHAMKSVFIKE